MLSEVKALNNSHGVSVDKSEASGGTWGGRTWTKLSQVKPSEGPQQLLQGFCGQIRTQWRHLGGAYLDQVKPS